MSDDKMKLYWMDQGPIDDMPREKLVEIVYQLHAELSDMRRDGKSLARLLESASSHARWQ